MLLKRHIPEVDPDSEIVVIDDVLSEGHLAMILEAVKSTSFPWYYLPNTHTYLDDERADSFGFIHSLYEPATFSAEPSNYLNVMSPILYIMLDRTDLQFKNLLRARVNLSVLAPKQVAGYPHVDYPKGIDYFSGLFYLEDSDGDTCFYDYKCVEGVVNNPDGKIIKRVEPKRNRGVIFNGHIAHSASLPLVHPTRRVVNFCFEAVSRGTSF